MSNTIKRISAFKGIRVEISPSHDLWMAGARFGTIRSIDTRYQSAVVKLDKIGKLQKIKVSDLSGWIVPSNPGRERAIESYNGLRPGNRVYFTSADPSQEMVGGSADPGRNSHAAIYLFRSDLECESFTCPLCGQRIDDGKPCGCGARS